MGVTLCVALSLAALGVPASAEAPAVPGWFKADPKNPYAVFHAWRNLSTREAAICLGNGWDVCAGLLQDEQGKPISDCLLGIFYHDALRPYLAHLRTDKDGYFIVYSPYESPLLRLHGMDFSAAPAYPFSQMGMAFASANKDFRKCRVRAVPVAEDRCFCVLTCPRDSKYDNRQFGKFMERETAEWGKGLRAAYRARPQLREGTTGRGVRNEYPVKVVSPGGDGIANAVLLFSAYDGFEGNSQTVLADEKGTCTLVEELLAGQQQKYYDGVQRWLTVDIPGYAVGPVPLDLKKGRESLITAKQGACVQGRVADSIGNPFRQRLSVRYRNPNHCSFELDAVPAPDGLFAIERIMPGEPFRLRLCGGSHQTTPTPTVWSDTFLLKPGEIRKGIDLKVPQAAAVRGIVVDEEDRPVAGIWWLAVMNEFGGWGCGEPKDGRFGAHGLFPAPVRIEVRAKGFEPSVSPEIPLEPGEMRFIKVVMKKESSIAGAGDGR